MKISIARSAVWTHLGDEFDFYRHIRECGFRYVDYDLFSTMTSDDAPYMRPDWEKTAGRTRESMEKIGVCAITAHAPAGEPAAPGMTEKLLMRTRRAVEVCAALGIKTVGVYDRISRTDQEAIRDLAWDYLPEGASLAELTRILDNAESADNKSSK